MSIMSQLSKMKKFGGIEDSLGDTIEEPMQSGTIERDSKPEVHVNGQSNEPFSEDMILDNDGSLVSEQDSVEEDLTTIVDEVLDPKNSTQEPVKEIKSLSLSYSDLVMETSSNPDKEVAMELLNIHGIEYSEDIVIATPQYSDVTPRPFEVIGDEDGVFAGKVRDFIDTYNIDIVPNYLVPVVPSTVTPKFCKEFNYNGVRYLYFKTDWDQVVNQTVDGMLEDLRYGRVVKLSLFREVEGHSGTKTFWLPPQATQDLLTYLKAYSPKIVKVKDDLLVVVGDYLRV